MSSMKADALSGILPWVAFGVLQALGYTTAACLSAGVVMLTTLMLARNTPGIIDLGASTFFLISGLLGLAWGGARVEPYLGILANLTMMSFVLVSILRRQPFTVRYARRSAPPAVWEHPHFYIINYLISGFWCIAFLGGAMLAYCLSQNPNLPKYLGNLAPAFSLGPAVVFTLICPPLYKRFIYSFEAEIQAAEAEKT